MVRTDSPYQHFRHLAGKRIAIPSRFAVDFLFLRKMLAQRGHDAEGHPDRRDAAARHAGGALRQCGRRLLHRRAVRRRRAARRLRGAPLRMTRDEWRNYICCVLTVREELITENRPLVQDLVNHVLGAGQSGSTQKQENRNKAVAIAAGRKFFNQDPNILRFVMENPVDRVTYGDLRMIRAEFEELMQLSIEAGTIKQPDRLREVHGREFRQGGARRRHRALSRATDDCCSSRRFLAADPLLLAVATATSRAAAPALKAGVFEPPRQAPEFALRGSDGAELTLARYRGKVVLLSFGFTIALPCARHTLATLAAGAPARSAQQPTAVQVRVRDRGSRARRRRRSMKAYLAAFDASFVGGTGQPEALAAMRKNYGVVAIKVPMADGYAMDHTSSDLPDRPRRQAARDDALWPRRRGLRARRQAAAGDSDGAAMRARRSGRGSRVRAALRSAARDSLSLLRSAPGLGCAGADRDRLRATNCSRSRTAPGRAAWPATRSRSCPTRSA